MISYVSLAVGRCSDSSAKDLEKSVLYTNSITALGTQVLIIH